MFSKLTHYHNRLENLEVLSASEHSRVHHPSTTLLDERPQRVLTVLSELNAAKDPVTGEAVANRVGFSRANTWKQLKTLRDAGLVTWTPRRAGTIRLTVEEVNVD